MTHAEFLARAWKLANDKARELGWIEWGLCGKAANDPAYCADHAIDCERDGEADR